ncbi:WD40 repeat domain-containing protein [Candidatus Dependentiae bacterium]|nr:WD40 repeat domain-containing protein [Candidatus Dependentiae bacterium]
MKKSLLLFLALVSLNLSAMNRSLTTKRSDEQTTRLHSNIPLEGLSTDIPLALFKETKDKIVATSWDTSLRVYATQTGHQRTAITEHSDLLTQVAGKTVGFKIVTANGYTALIWDAKTGNLVTLLKGHNGEVLYAIFNICEDKILTTSRDKKALLWNTKTGEVLQAFEGHTDAVTCAAFTYSGDKIITASRDTTALLWDATTGEKIKTLRGHTMSITAVAFNHTADKIITTSADGTAILWDAHTGSSLNTFMEHPLLATFVAFNPAGDQVAIVSGYKAAVVYTTTRGQRLTSLIGHTDFLTRIAFNFTEEIKKIAADKTSAYIQDINSTTSAKETLQDVEYLDKDTSELACCIQ